MKTLAVNHKCFMFIVVALLILIGFTQGSYGQTITASVQQPLTEVNLHENVVTLTLSGGTYERSRFTIERAVMLSGIDGVTIADFFGVDRVSDTVVTIELAFAGNIDADGTLTVTVGAGAIAGYSGNALTATLPVTAVAESLTASTESSLTETTLHGTIITLTLTGRRFAEFEWDIEDAVSLSGIDGVTIVDFFGVDRVSDTKVTIELAFAGNMDADGTLTLTVDADAIAGYGEDFNFEFSVTAVEESLEASTESPLTEAALHGSIITLTLTGRHFVDEWDIGNAVSLSGIDGVTVETFRGIDRVSDTVVTLELSFGGDFDTDGTLTLTVGADAIGGYDEDFTFEFPVTAMEESLEASTESPLTEATLHGTIITLTLTGRHFADEWDIGNAISLSGIDGVTVETFLGIDRVSDTVATLALSFESNIDADGTLTLTVGADAISYNEDFTFEFPVTAVEESLTASTGSTLTEATLDGGIVTLTLSGRVYEEYSFQIEDALTVSGIDGVTVEEYVGVERVSDTEVSVALTFDGDLDSDATLTFTVGADAIAGYKEGFTAEIPVTAIPKSNATVNISPASVVSPDVGEELTFSINITGGENVAGYQVTVSFDSSALLTYDPTTFRRLNFTNGNYLPGDPFFANPVFHEEYLGNDMWESSVTIAANTLAGAANGDGTLATLTFQVVDFKPSTVTLSRVYLVDTDGKRWEVTMGSAAVTLPPEPAEETVGDINRDGVVDLLDLAIVSARFGQRGQNSADLNGDGLVDIVDLVLVAGAFDEAAAPSLYPQVLDLFTAAEVRQWLLQAQQLSLRDAASLKGILFLEQLLAALLPKETVLLPNYPNPFNPETWIPYRLEEDAFVILTIYDRSGQAVRTLEVGHRVAAFYESRSKAIHWDGRNEIGEQVASGVYFYHLSAGDFSATRKMLILK